MDDNFNEIDELIGIVNSKKAAKETVETNQNKGSNRRGVGINPNRENKEQRIGNNLNKNVKQKAEVKQEKKVKKEDKKTIRRRLYALGAAILALIGIGAGVAKNQRALPEGNGKQIVSINQDNFNKELESIEASQKKMENLSLKELAELEERVEKLTDQAVLDNVGEALGRPSSEIEIVEAGEDEKGIMEYGINAGGKKVDISTNLQTTLLLIKNKDAFLGTTDGTSSRTASEFRIDEKIKFCKMVEADKFYLELNNGTGKVELNGMPTLKYKTLYGKNKKIEKQAKNRVERAEKRLDRSAPKLEKRAEQEQEEASSTAIDVEEAKEVAAAVKEAAELNKNQIDDGWDR